MRQLARAITFFFKATPLLLILATLALFFVPFLLSAFAFIAPNGVQIVNNLPEGVLRSLGMKFVLWAIIIWVLGLLVRLFLHRAGKFKDTTSLPAVCKGLTAEQCNVVFKPVTSAFFNPFVWALLYKLPKLKWLSLIPGVHIITGGYLALTGPAQLWQRGGWTSFEEFEKRLKRTNLITWLTFIIFVGCMIAVIIYCYTVLLALVMGLAGR